MCFHHVSRVARNQLSALLCGRFKHLPSAKKDNSKKKDKHADCAVEVLAVFEMPFTDGKSFDVKEGEKVVKLVKALGLDVVGCAIGSKLETSVAKEKKAGKDATNKDLSRSLWRPSHVHSCLQLKSLLPPDDNESLAVLGVAVNGSDLTLEAYQLSDQAMTLYETKILTANPINDKAKSFEADKVILASDVLVHNEEVSSVDCALFSVPLAIVSVDKSSPSGLRKTITPNRRGKANTLKSASNPESIKVEALSDGIIIYYNVLSKFSFT